MNSIHMHLYRDEAIEESGRDGFSFGGFSIK